MAGAGGAVAVLGVEVCAPLLMLCWLCCWPDDAKSDSSSSEKQPKKPVILEAGRRRSGDLFGRRFGSSAVSLHLPGTSGIKKQPLSAHRSHEEIRSRRKSHLETGEDTARYHSAPSVIDEVLHRRDWERSTKELYIPLRPDAARSPSVSPNNELVDAQALLDHKSDEEIIGRPCKKHYTNIKTSRNKSTKPVLSEPATTKELTDEEAKDVDASEQTPSASSFYIGDASCGLNKENIDNREIRVDERRTIRAKDVKQSLNESLKSRDRPRNILGPLTEFQVSGVFDMEDLPDVDRSGAVHHLDEPRATYCDTPSVPYPPVSAEPVELHNPGEVGAVGVVGVVSPVGGVRARHASAGDVLAPLLRPHSAALSESDLDFDLECCDEPPPAYDEIQMLAIAQRKETAI